MVMRLLAKEYMASVEQVSFWRSEKAIPAVSLNRPIQGYCFHVSYC